jgi:hypothetical protein
MGSQGNVTSEPRMNSYEGVTKRFRTESITKYMLTTINTRWEATQRVMAAKLTRLTHKIAIQLYLVAKSFTVWGSRSRRPVRKLLDTTSYSFGQGPVTSSCEHGNTVSFSRRSRNILAT